jgi:hypothetical protein
MDEVDEAKADFVRKNVRGWSKLPCWAKILRFVTFAFCYVSLGVDYVFTSVHDVPEVLRTPDMNALLVFMPSAIMARSIAWGCAGGGIICIVIFDKWAASIGEAKMVEAGGLPHKAKLGLDRMSRTLEVMTQLQGAKHLSGMDESYKPGGDDPEAWPEDK